MESGKPNTVTPTTATQNLSTEKQFAVKNEEMSSLEVLQQKLAVHQAGMLEGTHGETFS